MAVNIGKSFKKRPVLRGVTLSLDRGEAVGLLGPNGAGKTTCFYIVTGLISPDYGWVTLDGHDMVRHIVQDAIRCVQLARSTVDAPIDYINTHGTSTPVGDTQELLAIREVFGENIPRFASSKSLCGHSLGATGVQEAIHCLLMLENDFIAPSINVVDPDPGVEGMPVVTSRVDNAGLTTAMSNSFGFGGTNATLILQKIR